MKMKMKNAINIEENLKLYRVNDIAVYKDVIIAGTDDSRIMDFIDDLKDCMRKNIVVVNLRKGCLNLVVNNDTSYEYWRNYDGYSYFGELGNDTWSVTGVDVVIDGHIYMEDQDVENGKGVKELYVEDGIMYCS